MGKSGDGDGVGELCPGDSVGEDVATVIPAGNSTSTALKEPGEKSGTTIDAATPIATKSLSEKKVLTSLQANGQIGAMRSLDMGFGGKLPASPQTAVGRRNPPRTARRPAESSTRRESSTKETGEKRSGSGLGGKLPASPQTAVGRRNPPGTARRPAESSTRRSESSTKESEAKRSGSGLGGKLPASPQTAAGRRNPPRTARRLAESSTRRPESSTKGTEAKRSGSESRSVSKKIQNAPHTAKRSGLKTVQNEGLSKSRETTATPNVSQRNLNLENSHRRNIKDLRGSAPQNPRGTIRLWNPKRKYKGVVPNLQTRNLAECLAGATFCWPLKRPEYAPAILDQRGSETCYIYPIISGMDYAAFLTKGMRNVVGSAQEIRDRLHHLAPKLKSKMVPLDPRSGYENTSEAGLWYVRNWANFPDAVYPSLPGNKTAKLKDTKAINPPGSKIIIDNYTWLNEIKERQHRVIKLQVKKYPVIATIAVKKTRFERWNGMDAYTESKGMRASVNRYVKKLKDPGNKNEEVVDDEDVVFHSILIVGWGYTEEGVLVYVFQNSWGESWGYLGYGMISADCIMEAGWPMNVQLIKVKRDEWAEKRDETLARNRNM